ncbi:MAG: hypothetical protein ACTHN2_03195, partial [Nitrobacter sp.]
KQFAARKNVDIGMFGHTVIFASSRSRPLAARPLHSIESAGCASNFAAYCPKSNLAPCAILPVFALEQRP